MKCYDPDKVITAVQELLRQHGLDAEITDGLTAHTGASMLLRGLGIMPAIDAIDAYRKILDAGPWPEADDRRAARSD